MALCTFLYENEFKEYSTIPYDRELDELLQEIRAINPRYYVKKFHRSYREKWYKKMKIITLYKVYSRISTMEVQELALPTYSITKEQLFAFFYGVLNGVDLKIKE